MTNGWLVEGGVGTELTNLLKWLRLTYTATCKCRARASLMDKNGIRWCENSVGLIVSWMREEAECRKLPFSQTAATAIVKLAIRRAKRKVKNHSEHLPGTQPLVQPPVPGER